jgi:AcrR family transcriptional regulator
MAVRKPRAEQLPQAIRSVDQPEAVHRGRPRSSAADRAILDAAIELMGEVGIEHTTMSAVVARSGLARATVYRRYPNREALIAAAIREVKGRPPYPISGDFETDLARAADQTRAIFAEPRFQAFLPTLVRDLLQERPTDGMSETFERVAPNHRRVAEEFGRFAERAGLRTDIDPFVPSNIIVGAILVRLLSTGQVPSREIAHQFVDVILNGLRAR